ncbi:MAG: TolC family protein [Alphaproteobacteria bacterium]|nr:TolC family protein [Alphaproteobacteria bacterium]
MSEAPGRPGSRRTAGLARAACLALACLAAAASAQTGGPERLALTLDEAVRLALSRSRAAISVRLGREEQKLSLEAAEERYDPMASVTLGTRAASRGDETADLSLGPSLRVPTGGSFSLSFRKPLAGERDREASTTLSFSQPLLRGFGTELDTQPLRRARLQERIDLRRFRDAAAGIVEGAVSAYRGVLRAGQRLVIAREALERARRQLEINRALVEAGRMAPQDLVQTEADVADKEYALADAENALETANSRLVNTLDLEEGVRIEPQAEPPIEPERPDLEESLETAFARRTDWLRAETGMAFARMGLRSAENALLPDLSLSAEAAHRSGRDLTLWSGGLNLTVPLQNDEERRQLTRARNGLRRAEMAIAETRQSIRIEVRQAVHDVAVALRQIDLAGQARALAERKLDVERRKLQLGLSSAFQLGRFEDDLVNAQRRELDAVARYRDSLGALDRTLGTTLDRWGISVEQVGR